MISEFAQDPPPAKLTLDRKLQPCAAQEGDELYANGIFEFNISRALQSIAAHPDQFKAEMIAVADLPHFGDQHLDEATVRTADLSRPVLLAEIAPERYNLIDGHHRLARARREGVLALGACRLRAAEHVAFLTSTEAYAKYVAYWNDKVRELQRLFK